MGAHLKPSKKTRQRRKAVAQLDRECREYVFLRDDHKCVRCGERRTIQWAHILSRERRRASAVRPWPSLTGSAGSMSFCGTTTSVFAAVNVERFNGRTSSA